MTRAQDRATDTLEGTMHFAREVLRGSLEHVERRSAALAGRMGDIEAVMTDVVHTMATVTERAMHATAARCGDLADVITEQPEPSAPRARRRPASGTSHSAPRGGSTRAKTVPKAPPRRTPRRAG